MNTRIQKWGNSLAIRIPKALADETRLAEGATVDLTLVEGKLVIEAQRPREYSLAELLEEVTETNRHAEVDTGGIVGREAW
jgi:antitoxin MazE